MGTMKSIIDGNEAASKYTEYMRKARKDGDNMPTKHHTDPEKRAYARELNNELDKLHFGYVAPEGETSPATCDRCGGPVDDNDRIVRSIYPDHKPRIDIRRCGNC